jgi:hypothetical protein
MSRFPRICLVLDRQALQQSDPGNSSSRGIYISDEYKFNGSHASIGVSARFVQVAQSF